MIDYIDQYCERLEPGLWSEPLNAVTNLAFAVSAYLSWRLARSERQLTPDIYVLITFMVAISIGSGLFHTFATQWSKLLDVLPIALFQIMFLWVYSRRVIRFGWGLMAIVMTLFLVASWVAAQFPTHLNGSLGYAPALVTVALLACWHHLNAARERNALITATAMFGLALIFRTMDQAVCPHLPIGTHFLWHLSNSAVLYLSMRALITHLPRQSR